MRLLHRAALAGALWLGTGVAALADRAGELQALMAAMRISDTVEIMQEEGRVYGGDLAREMIPEVDPDVWQRVIEKIYDGDKMYAVLLNGFEAELSGTDLQPLLAYFRSEKGAEIVALELAARRAFLDRETEAQAAEAYRKAADRGAELVEQVDILMKDSDLVEFNVMGALNADLMFYNGLNEGGAFDLSEDEILADVWAGEEELRESSRDWLRSFLLMSYQPLEIATLKEYAAFWRTEEGRDLNRAIFVAFDTMYEDLSYLLGLAIAEQMTIEEL